MPAFIAACATFPEAIAELGAAKAFSTTEAIEMVMENRNGMIVWRGEDGRLAGSISRNGAIATNEELSEIVRAVNSHAGLVAALEELVAEFDRADLEAGQRPGCYGINETGGIVLARLALRKAKGEA